MELTNRPLTSEAAKKLMALDVQDKEILTYEKLDEWYTAWGGQCYVSFSGGKDSTVLAYLAAAFFMQTVHKFLDGLADVRDVGGTRDPYVAPMEFKPVVTYRLDEQIGWHLLQARILGGGAICHLSTDD